ncbi:MAG: hypothetical protein AAFX06_20685 [Planctomycetota bacterium]
MSYDSIYVDRPDLLEMPFFWRCVFARQLMMAESHESPSKHFGFRCRETRPKKFTSETERRTKYPEDSFVSHFACLDVSPDWKVGRTFHNCPEDNTISFDIVSRAGTRLTVGSDWGHFFEPSFRWTEVKRIANATKSRKTRHQMILLLLTGVGGDFSADQDEMRDEVFDALLSLEFATKNVAELADHLVSSSYTPAEWYYDRSIGWVNDGRYTFRCTNKSLSLSRGQFLMLRRFFRSLP